MASQTHSLAEHRSGSVAKLEDDEDKLVENLKPKLKEALPEYKDKDLDYYIWFTRLPNEKGVITYCKIEIGSKGEKMVLGGDGDNAQEALKEMEYALGKGYVKPLKG